MPRSFYAVSLSGCVLEVDDCAVAQASQVCMVSMKLLAQRKQLSVENSVIYSDWEEGERHHAECC